MIKSGFIVTGRLRRAIKAGARAGSLSIMFSLPFSVAMVEGAQAITAITGRAVNMREGPSTRYPVVVRIPRSAVVDINHCLRSASWCDVTWDGWRGWVSARYLLYTGGTYRSAPIYEIYTVIGIPIFTGVPVIYPRVRRPQQPRPPQPRPPVAAPPPVVVPPPGPPKSPISRPARPVQPPAMGVPARPPVVRPMPPSAPLPSMAPRAPSSPPVQRPQIERGPSGGMGAPPAAPVRKERRE